MANTFAPFGFRSFGDQEGSAPTMGLTKLNLASSDTNNYFTGDVVSISTGGNGPIGFIGLPSSGTVPNQPIVGIFAGCEFFSPTVGRTVWSSFFTASVGSSANGLAYVITDPNQQFLVQCTTTAVIGTSNIGMLVGFGSSLQAAGNTTTGISNEALNSSTINSSTTGLPFRIIDTTSGWAPPGTNGADGTTAGAIVIVGFNNQYRRTLTTASS